MSSDPSQELISLSQAAERYGLSADFLRQLVLKGRLNARKIGRNWVTTPADVEAYIQSRRKIGAYKENLKPKKHSTKNTRK